MALDWRGGQAEAGPYGSLGSLQKLALPWLSGCLVLWVHTGAFSALHSLGLESLALVILSWVRRQPFLPCPWKAKLIDTTAEVLDSIGSQAGGFPGGDQQLSAWRPVDPAWASGKLPGCQNSSPLFLRVLSPEAFPATNRQVG